MSTSTILAPSATLLTESGQGEANYPFHSMLQHIAAIAKKNLTRGGYSLDRTKLVSAMCKKYRETFSAIYAKNQDLPKHIHSKICDEVDSFITKELTGAIHPGNSFSVKRSFNWVEKENDINEKVTAVGYNQLESYKERIFGATLFIGQAERRLKDLLAKPTPDLEQEAKLKQRIERLQLTRNYLIAEQERQEKLISSIPVA